MLFTSIPFDDNSTLIASSPTADEAAENNSNMNIPIHHKIKMSATSVKNYYDSEDDEETLATAIDDLSSLILYPSHSSADAEVFQEQMQDPTNARISQYQNTYFMDGGVRFISLPTLGTSSTKLTTPIARIFEDWLANKLYSHPNKTVNLHSNTYQNVHCYRNNDNDDMMIMDQSPEDELDDQLPILEDNIELLSEDIMNMFKSRKRNLKGLSKILIKVRTGHVYSYHQLESGQPLITEDMEDFFQQFPLFVEIIIYATQKQQSSQTASSTSFSSSLLNSPYYYHHCQPAQQKPSYQRNTDELTLLLAMENTSLNLGNPYTIMETISL
ncbi:hypothetical protein BDF20DRAFT_909516 [Mycotypha africana]|uniref:uncharacterized protein n=1 Tax=Mycotypha africana TaxID=64632 RepID=UPI0023000CA8|nr:uncharacterized protein BDF20DRAFT_909516 [Mycotypha africana]KAI8991786.1 hypothetical protein BDF20DRAFT_909516 [Mycotypha africana]